MVIGLDISQTKEEKISYKEFQFKNRHINAENWWLPEKRGAGQWAKQVKGIKKDRLPVTKVTTMLHT